MSNEQCEIEKTNASLHIARCLLHIFYVLLLLPFVHVGIVTV